MALTLSTDLTLVNTTGGDAESLTNWASIGTWSGTTAVSNDVYLQGSNAINGRVTSAAPPTPVLGWYHLATQAANTDYTDGRHVFFWIKTFCQPSLDTRARGGIGVSISSDATPTKTGTDPNSGATNSKQWYMLGNDFNPTSGWVCYVVDPQSTPDLSLGSPAMNSVDRIGIRASAIATVGGGSVKPFPILWDALRYGTYLKVVGDGSTTATLRDFLGYDTATSAQYGIINLTGGIYGLQGKLLIGDTAQANTTTFTDTGQVIVFSDMPVATGFYEVKIVGASTKTTTVTLGSISGSVVSKGCTLQGTGWGTQRLIAAAVSAGGSGYAVGNTLTVSGGTLSPGGSAAQVEVLTLSGSAVATVKPTYGGSYTSPPTGTLSTTGGAGSGCTLTATAAGGSVWTLTASDANQTTNLYACTLSQLKSAALASTGTWNGCTVVDSGTVTPSGATVKNCSFQDLRTTAPMSATYQIDVSGSTPVLTGNRYTNCATALRWNVNADTNTKLDSSVFTSGGTGYAIELGSNCPSSITLTNVTFSGYGSTGTANAAIYNNSGKSITINITGGTSPTYNNGAGASTTIVSGSVTAAVNVKSPSGSNLSGARVLLQAAAGGLLPSYATVSSITNSGTTATVNHTSHGLSNGDKVAIRGASLAANNGVFTITYINTNSYSYTMGSSPGSSPTGTITSTFVAISGTTDASGNITATRVYSGDQPVSGWVRDSTSPTFYKTSDLIGTISATAGLSIGVQMVSDT